MKTKKLFLLVLTTLVMCLTLSVAKFVSAEGEVVTPEEPTGLVTNIGDALGNGRVTQEIKADYQVTLALTDGQPTQTRMVYKEKVDASNFEMNFTIDQFNEDGYLKIAFLSSETDYPMENYGDGFGLVLWDETAWGQPLLTSLRPDSWSFSKTEGAKKIEDKALRGGAGNSFVGKNVYLHVWEWDADNLAFNVKLNNGSTDMVDMTGGMIPKSNFAAGFDYKDCYLFITPDIDSRAHSYDNDIKLTIKDVNGVTPAKGGTKTFEEVVFGDNTEVLGRVTVESNYGLQTTLALTDGNFSQTRAYYKKPVVIDAANNKWFEMNFTFDQFNVDGYLDITFLSSSQDFPMDIYGKGFGVKFWDETAWGNPELKSFRCDFYKYGTEANFTGKTDDKAVRSSENTIIGQNFHLKVWEYDADNLAIQVDRDDNGTNVQAIGTFAKSNLPEGFDFHSCILMITPGVDSREHSYEKDIILTIKDINGEDPSETVESYNVTATAGEHGKVISNFKTTALKGSNVTFTITPDKGYVIDTATLNDETVTVENNVYVAENIQGDVAFNVTFKEEEIPENNALVDATSAGHGKVKALSNDVEVTNAPKDSTIKFVFLPDVGYMIDTVTVNGSAVNVTNNEYQMTLTEDVALVVTYKAYTFDEESHFVPGMWDAQKGRINTVVTANGEELTFAVSDGKKTESRAYSAALDITKDTKISFKIVDMAAGAGIRLSFVATADDYPLSPWGDGFSVNFQNIATAIIASPISTSRLDGVGDNFLGDGEYTILNGTDISAHTYTLRIADYDKTASTVKVYLDLDGENVDYFTVNFGSLAMAFDPQACFLLLTPEITDDASRAVPVKVIVTEYDVEFVSTDPIIEEDEVEYKITYMNGDKVVKIAYATEGDKFTKYVPEDETFVGWYVDAELTTEFNFDQVPTADVVVYGKYVAPVAPAKKGCGSTISMGVITLVSLAAGAIFLTKKSKKD